MGHNKDHDIMLTVAGALSIEAGPSPGTGACCPGGAARGGGRLLCLDEPAPFASIAPPAWGKILRILLMRSGDVAERLKALVC